MMCKVSSIVFWLALTIWIAALVSAAIAAAHVFSILPTIGVSLSSFSTLPADDQARIAGGKVMQQLFATVDLIQVVCAPLTIFAMLIQSATCGIRWRRAANVIRSACLVVAACLLTFHVMILSPRMNRELTAYWFTATSDSSAAAIHRAAFDQDHPRASRIHGIMLTLLLVAVAASAASTSGQPKRIEGV